MSSGAIELCERLVVVVEVDKPRPGVVLYVGTAKVAVATGTKTDRTDFEPHVKVDLNSRDGRALRLEYTTWFLAPVSFVDPVKVRPIGSGVLCPPQLFAELRMLVQCRGSMRR